METIFDKLKGWTLGRKYNEGVLTSIEVNPDETVTVGLDYGKTTQTFEYSVEQEMWLRTFESKSHQALLSTRLTSLPFNRRSYHTLQILDIDTIGELLELSEDDFMRVRNCGRGTIRDIKEVLWERGLSLKPNEIRKRKV